MHTGTIAPAHWIWPGQNSLKRQREGVVDQHSWQVVMSNSSATS
jgi:hypothetical protein